jgi:hypothetical protein
MRKYGILFRENLPLKSCKSLSLHMSITHLSNVASGKDFVNKLATLLHDLICKILISPPGKTILKKYISYN